MPAPYIHVYKDAPTPGGADGTLVSEGDGSSPISVGPLDTSTNEESAPIALALRCDPGCATDGDVVVTPVGDTASRWALSVDGVVFGDYGAALTLTDVTDVNKPFFAKARADSTEGPLNDTTVDLRVDADIVAL